MNAELIEDLGRRLVELAAAGEPLVLSFRSGGVTAELRVRVGPDPNTEPEWLKPPDPDRPFPVEVVELIDREAEVLDLFTRQRQKLQAKELAPLLGRSNDSRLRNLLSAMRTQRGLLDNDVAEGYFPTLSGMESLRAWRRQREEMFGEPVEQPTSDRNAAAARNGRDQP